VVGLAAEGLWGEQRRSADSGVVERIFFRGSPCIINTQLRASQSASSVIFLISIMWKRCHPIECPFEYPTSSPTRVALCQYDGRFVKPGTVDC
jgi:hypothetical protein